MLTREQPVTAAVIAGAEALSVVNIDDPSSELNAITGTVKGAKRLCYQTAAGADEWVLYAWDNADSSLESVPYRVDGSAGMWIAIAGKHKNGAQTINAGLTTTGSITTTSVSNGVAIQKTTGVTLTVASTDAASVTLQGGLSVVGIAASGAVTVTNASGVTSLQAATQDAMRLLGRAGGTSGYIGSLTPTTLTASRTYTFPDTDTTMAGLAVAQTFTAAQTFSGNISQTGATTLGTGTGAVSLNGDTTIPSGKTLTVASDTDATTILGRARIHSSTSDRLYLGHFDMSTTSNYALLQLSSGQTKINAASGQELDLAISNSNIIALTASLIQFNVTVAQADGGNWQLGTTNGTKIATATTQKLAFWNATPIVQPSSTGETTGWTTGGGSAATSTDTYTGNSGTKAYTINDIVKHLKAIGLLAGS